MKTTSRRRGRALTLWAVVLLVALVAGHILLWRWADQRLRAGFDAWVTGRRAAGWEVRAGPPVAAGWPFAAGLIINQVAVAGARSDIPDGFAWSTDTITLSVALLRPRVLTIVPDGAQRLRVGSLPAIQYTADRLVVTVPLDPEIPAHVADLGATSLRAGVAGSSASPGLTVGLLSLHADLRPAAIEGEPALALQSSAEAITLPPGLPRALGTRVSSLSFDGALNGPLPRMPGLVRRVTAWREGGGTIEIRRFALGWGPLGVTGGATLALDSKLQLMGTGTARIIGFAETLDALAAGGVLNPHAALAAKALAGLIATTSEAGGASEIEVPLTLQDRSLSVRQIPLARMPAMQWPPD